MLRREISFEINGGRWKGLKAHQCMDGIADMIKDVQVTPFQMNKLVTVHYPIRKDKNNETRRNYFRRGLKINQEMTSFELNVSNSGDRPIQVGSHFHFSETNEALKFDEKSVWMPIKYIPSNSS